MSGLFSKPEVLEMPNIQAPVMPEQVAEEEEVKEEEKKKKKRSKGTLLTGPRGILESPPVGIKTLLGE